MWYESKTLDPGGGTGAKITGGPRQWMGSSLYCTVLRRCTVRGRGGKVLGMRPPAGGVRLCASQRESVGLGGEQDAKGCCVWGGNYLMDGWREGLEWSYIPPPRAAFAFVLGEGCSAQIRN